MRNRIADQPPPRNMAALVRSAFLQARLDNRPGLKMLLDLGVPPDACSEQGESLLIAAVCRGQIEIARLLLDRGADPDLCGGHGITPLLDAVFHDSIEAGILLLDRGARPDRQGSDGLTPLMLAAMLDRVEMIDLLLARGASPRSGKNGACTPLEIARRMASERAVARLSGAFTARAARRRRSSG